MEKFHRNACKLLLYLSAKTRMGISVMLGTIDLFLLQLSSPNCRNITFCPVFYHLWPSQATSFVSNHNIALTCPYFHSNRLCHTTETSTPVFAAFLDASKTFDSTNHNLLFAKLTNYNVAMGLIDRYIYLVVLN